jgi:hypothetical protein
MKDTNGPKKQPKKPAAVVAAEALVSAKTAELAAAKEVVRRLEDEYRQAMIDAHTARTEADTALPQCNMVRVNRHSGTDGDPIRVVILRKPWGGGSSAAN